MLDAIRHMASRHVFSPLQGMTYGVWRSLAQEEEHDIDPPYRARAAFQAATALLNSAVTRVEARRFEAATPAAHVMPPLFILGHFRHGTTHLHNLLALDPRGAAPTLYQTLYPRTFLTTEALVPRLGSVLLLRTRPHDGVALNFGVPNEDELALCNDSAISPYLAWAFPRRAKHYDRFLTFRDATEDELGRWRASLLRFYGKLTQRYGRPLVLKAPPHTARVRLLLELFPDARFVHIRRDPYAVFRSTRHMYATTMAYWQFQRMTAGGHDDRILRVYREMYGAYFEQRGLIPAGRICEIRYEDLDRDPIGQVESIYSALSLGDFEAIRPRLQAYVASLGGYARNRHDELSEPDRRRVAAAWGRCFDEWGYER